MSVGGRGAGGKLGDHSLELVLPSGLVGLEECRRAPVELIGLRFLPHLLELGDLGADGRNLAALLLRRELVVALTANRGLLAFGPRDGERRFFEGGWEGGQDRVGRNGLACCVLSIGAVR